MTSRIHRNPKFSDSNIEGYDEHPLVVMFMKEAKIKAENSPEHYAEFQLREKVSVYEEFTRDRKSSYYIYNARCGSKVLRFKIKKSMVGIVL